MDRARALALACVISASACSSERDPRVEAGDAAGGAIAPPGSLPIVPRTVSALHDAGLGSVLFDVVLDGVPLTESAPLTVSSRASGDTDSITMDLPPGALLEGGGRVDVAFRLVLADGTVHPLAETTQNVRRPISGASVTLSGLGYRYTDSDRDGLADVHEFAAPALDVDGDGRRNHEDTDADGDGTSDGDDPTPIGAPAGTSGVVLELDVKRPDGSRERLAIERVRGTSGETRRLAGAGTALAMRVPSGWPAGPPAGRLDRTRWSAFELDARDGDPARTGASTSTRARCRAASAKPCCSTFAGAKIRASSPRSARMRSPTSTCTSMPDRSTATVRGTRRCAYCSCRAATSDGSSCARRRSSAERRARSTSRARSVAAELEVRA